MSTIASTGGGESTGQASTGASSTGVQVMGWGDDWRTRMNAGGDDKTLKQLERYESPEQIWRKARELETKLSSGELRSVLKKDATPEEMNRWRAENGVPAKAEEYKINMPAGKQTPKEDDAFLKSFLATAHANNYNQTQVDGAINTFYAEVDRLGTAAEEADAAAVQATDDKLRQEWGADYRLNTTLEASLLARAPAGFSDRFLNGKLADGTPIRASLEARKWLVQLEREINPAGTVVPGAGADPGKTIAAELTDLKTLMADGNSAYWKGPLAEAKQARYRQLLEADEKIKARAAA